MGTKIHQQFIEELQRAEQTRDVSKLAALFGDNAILSKPAAKDALDDGYDAGQFWQHYLDTFSQIRSTFTNVVDGGATAVLEWTSEGKLPDEQPIEYRGVSILETEGGKIRAFRTYYDSAVFLLPGHRKLAQSTH